MLQMRAFTLTSESTQRELKKADYTNGSMFYGSDEGVILPTVSA